MHVFWVISMAMYMFMCTEAHTYICMCFCKDIRIYGDELQCSLVSGTYIPFIFILRAPPTTNQPSSSAIL